MGDVTLHEQRGLCESASRASECDRRLRPVRLVCPVRPVRPSSASSAQCVRLRPVCPVRQVASDRVRLRQTASKI
eukprot:4363600-Prymnesium_polylepis.1